MVNLTKSVVDKIKPLSDKNQSFYRDDKIKGFALRVTSSGVKSFILETRIEGKVKRMTLGKYGNVTVEEARKEAKKLLGQIVQGQNPLAIKKEKKVKAITLQEAFNSYLKARKDLKPNTVIDYKQALNQVAPDWLNKPLTSITRDMVKKRHLEHGKHKSKARANNAMRVLRTIFNYAIHEYQTGDDKSIITVNPIEYLSHTRGWYNIKRRQTVIKPNQLAAWYVGLKKLSEQDRYSNASMWQDYFLLVLFTGLRKMEAASLLWKDIDLYSKTLTVHDTKNGESHTLPMSNEIYEIFLRRQKLKTSDFVFPAKSQTGYMYEPRKAVLKVSELSGVPFTTHDLRRTFATTAESLELSAYALKRLLNHKMNNDVTAGYIIGDVERLRKPMQKITDFMVKHMNEPVETIEG